MIRTVHIWLAVVMMTGSVIAADNGTTNINACLQGFLSQLAASETIEPRLSLTNDVISLAGHTIRITATAERTLPAEGKFVVAARFDVMLDGAKVDSLTFGSIGVGGSEKEGLTDTVHEWYMSFGAAMFRAVANSTPSLIHDGYRVYSGFMGIRGEPPQDWVDGTTGMQRNVLAAVALPHFKEDKTRFHGLSLKVMMATNGTVKGECQIDGKPSAVSLAALKNLPWPNTGAAYMFKQAYVLVGQ
jgi:hypothetical protein